MASRKAAKQAGDLEKGRVVTVHLPWPPAALSPNARGKWTRIRATKAYRGEARYAALGAMGAFRFTLRPLVEASVTFHLPDRRRRDQDNMEARLKAAWDGIVDSGLLEDDSMDNLRIVSIDAYVRKPGGVVIELREAQEPTGGR